MPEAVRPTKKQRELLTFIDNFIAGHGYGPSYREIMSGLGYKSVATVAAHVDNLIARGHLRKRDRSARSLEVIKQAVSAELKTNKVTPAQDRWLVDQVEQRLRIAEAAQHPGQGEIDELYVLVGSLKVLGFESAYLALSPRLKQLARQVLK